MQGPVLWIPSYDVLFLNSWATLPQPRIYTIRHLWISHLSAFAVGKENINKRRNLDRGLGASQSNKRGGVVRHRDRASIRQDRARSISDWEIAARPILGLSNHFGSSDIVKTLVQLYRRNKTSSRTSNSCVVLKSPLNLPARIRLKTTPSPSYVPSVLPRLKHKV